MTRIVNVETTGNYASEPSFSSKPASSSTSMAPPPAEFGVGPFSSISLITKYAHGYATNTRLVCRNPGGVEMVSGNRGDDRGRILQEGERGAFSTHPNPRPIETHFDALLPAIPYETACPAPSSPRKTPLK